MPAPRRGPQDQPGTGDRPARPRRHIAFFLPALGLGGAEHNLMTVLRGLHARGHRLDLVLMRAEGPLLDEVPTGVSIVNLGARTKPGSVPGLVRYLRQARPDAVLSAMATVNCMAVLAWRLAGGRGRLVLSERSTLSMEVAMDPRKRLLPPLMRRLYPLADAVTAVSAGVADDLARVTGLDRAAIRVIYNPAVGPGLAEAAEAPPGDPWFAPDAPPVVLAVGRLHPQKDYPTLLRAFARLRGTHPVRLMILGEGPEREALERLVRQLGLDGEVRMPGIVRRPFAQMGAAAVFVLCSRWEGLPTSLIEAMACGARVVSTDCPSGPAEILMDGALGALVPVGDATALAAALAAALDDVAARPGRRSYPLDRFREAPILDAYEDILCEGL